MWNPKRSLSTVSSSDKQNIKEVGDVNYCKNSAGVEQFEDQQEQNENLEQETSIFGGQLSGSTYIHHEENGENGDGNRKHIEMVDETVDSGFISGPQTSSSALLDTDNESAEMASCEINKLNIRDSSNDDSECDLKQPHSEESGLSEWFCNLSLQSNTNSQTNTSMSATRTAMNNLDVPRQQSIQQTKVSRATGSTMSQQLTWRKCYQQDSDGDTSLHLGCVSGSEDVVAFLIRIAPHPCLFNIKNDDVHAPLHLATLAVQPKIIRLLLIAGANPTVRDHHGNTPLHLACISGEEECVRALTVPISASEVNDAHRQFGYRTSDNCYLNCAQLPSDLEIRNYDGEKCVHIAAQAGFINILRILVFYGADINAKEARAGRTPLHIAIERSNEKLANYLLDDCQKIDIETETYARLTAYQMACVLKKSEMLNILEKRGAEPLTPPDSDIESDLDEADEERY